MDHLRLVSLKAASSVSGDFFDLFDLPSHVLWALASLVIASLHMLTLPTCQGAFSLSALQFDQSVSSLPRPRTPGKSLLALVWLLHCFFFGVMFKSLVITQLAAPSPLQQVESLEDLGKPQFSGSKVVTAGPSTVSRNVGLQLQAMGLGDRLLVHPFSEKPKLLDHVRQGHVIVVAMPKHLDQHLEENNAGADCRLDREDLHVSVGSLGRLVVAPMIRKGHPLTESMTMSLLRSFEAGLLDKRGTVYKHPSIVDSSCPVTSKKGTKVAKRPCMEERLKYALSLEHFRYPVQMLANMLAVSVVLFAAEVVWKWGLNNCRQRSFSRN